jgi:hypothetical protein
MSGSTPERDALAADLLADLAPQAEPPVTPAAPRRPRGARSTPAPAPEAGAEAAGETDGPRTRGPALQTVLRLEPFDWYKPLLRVQWLSVSMRVGPLYGQLGIRRAAR